MEMGENENCNNLESCEACEEPVDGNTFPVLTK